MVLLHVRATRVMFETSRRDISRLNTDTQIRGGLRVVQQISIGIKIDTAWIVVVVGVHSDFHDMRCGGQSTQYTTPSCGEYPLLSSIRQTKGIKSRELRHEHLPHDRLQFGPR